MNLNELINLNDSSVKEMIVDIGQTASFVGSGALDVLATPVLIDTTERIAHQMLESVLPPGWTSVGIYVAFNHMAPTPVDVQVRIKCEVSDIQDRQITFRVTAWDAFEKIGEGIHKRVAVNARRFLKKVIDKQISERK
jgi:predicted thioesterase